MEKKTAAEMLAPYIIAKTVLTEDYKIMVCADHAIEVAQEYAAQETAGMYSKEQVLSIIGDVKADAVILCDDYEDAQLIKQIDATHYLKPQP